MNQLGLYLVEEGLAETVGRFAEAQTGGINAEADLSSVESKLEPWEPCSSLFSNPGDVALSSRRFTSRAPFFLYTAKQINPSPSNNAPMPAAPFFDRKLWVHSDVPPFISCLLPLKKTLLDEVRECRAWKA